MKKNKIILKATRHCEERRDGYECEHDKAIFPILGIASGCALAMTLSFCALVSAQVLPLDSVLKRIEQNNPELKMYSAQIAADSSYAEGAKSWMPPTFSTGPWQAPYNNFSGGMWMFTGEQMIPNPSKLKANQNYMLGMIPVEQRGKGAERNQMFSMAKENYFEWVVLKKKYDVLVQTDSLLSYIVNIAQSRYTYNKEKLNNIYKAQADLYELRNMETMFIADMKMRNVEINTLMNTDKTFVFDIDTTLHLRSYELQLADTSLVASSRSDIKQFDASIGLLKLQEQYEKSKRLPDFGISYSHMQTLGQMPNQFSAMAMITIPIAPWASKEYKSNIKGLNSAMDAISFQKQSLINVTTGNIATLQTQMKSARQQIDNYNHQIIPAYYKSYQTAMLAYEQNTENLFVVLDALRMYRMASMDEFDQLQTLLKLQVDYEKEMEIR